MVFLVGNGHPSTQFYSVSSSSRLSKYRLTHSSPLITQSVNSGQLAHAYYEHTIPMPPAVPGEYRMDDAQMQAAYGHLRTFAKTCDNGSSSYLCQMQPGSGQGKLFLAARFVLILILILLCHVVGRSPERIPSLTAVLGRHPGDNMPSASIPSPPPILAVEEDRGIALLHELSPPSPPTPEGTYDWWGRFPWHTPAPQAPAPQAPAPQAPTSHSSTSHGRAWPAVAPMSSPPHTPPRLPIFPLQVTHLSSNTESLIVPTSCPHELEFPYALCSPPLHFLDPLASSQLPVEPNPIWAPSVEQDLLNKGYA